MNMKPWKSTLSPVSNPTRSASLTARAIPYVLASSHSDSPSDDPDGPSRRRGRPKENVGVRRRRLQQPDPSSDSVPRLPRLSLRVKAIRAVKPSHRPFSDAPPTLADLVCLATLEANLVWPNQSFAISITELPFVRVDPQALFAIQAGLLYLVDRANQSVSHLEVIVTLADPSQVVLELALPSSLLLGPRNSPTSFSATDLPITLADRSVSILLPVIDTPPEPVASTHTAH